MNQSEGENEIIALISGLVNVGEFERGYDARYEGALMNPDALIDWQKGWSYADWVDLAQPPRLLIPDESFSAFLPNHPRAAEQKRDHAFMALEQLQKFRRPKRQQA